MGGKINKRINPNDLLWDARKTTSHAIRNDRWVNTRFGRADSCGLSGDSRFVVLCADLIRERQRLIKDRDVFAVAVAELTQKKVNRIERLTNYIKERINAWRQGHIIAFLRDAWSKTLNWTRRRAAKSLLSFGLHGVKDQTANRST